MQNQLRFVDKFIDVSSSVSFMLVDTIYLYLHIAHLRVLCLLMDPATETKIYVKIIKTIVIKAKGLVEMLAICKLIYIT